jgi:hypothetical protein
MNTAMIFRSNLVHIDVTPGAVRVQAQPARPARRPAKVRNPLLPASAGRTRPSAGRLDGVTLRPGALDDGAAMQAPKPDTRRDSGRDADG